MCRDPHCLRRIQDSSAVPSDNFLILAKDSNCPCPCSTTFGEMVLTGEIGLARNGVILVLGFILTTTMVLKLFNSDASHTSTTEVQGSFFDDPRHAREMQRRSGRRPLPRATSVTAKRLHTYNKVASTSIKNVK
eukprot:Protomagalhaensia_wolfi_Nauph_80__1742@NODE_2085_length_1219_cov_14_378814_g821_i1_p1_GENE_NODE_2085_length_1219_cov_14_378814_g821_i1NODE_2085_length_1219_cov_14_378814_g821_i1_p1_ORF_typecomplete_len134_score4_71_NODE_2085_length_1219_cov_14_378814_g821_i164465